MRSFDQYTARNSDLLCRVQAMNPRITKYERLSRYVGHCYA